jgi:hypothetical protein
MGFSWSPLGSACAYTRELPHGFQSISHALVALFVQSHKNLQRLKIVTMSNRAAFLETPKGQFAVRDAEVPQPEQGEILIRVSLSEISFLQSYTCCLCNSSRLK